ncbi:serine carboxypeptidase S28-domain-containing protein [Mycena capillaripes]|nr:serine carboxypeptidase S28-domain-containing protein [Mycena capillaripes]
MLSLVWIACALAPLVAGARRPNSPPQLTQPALAFSDTRAAALMPTTTTPVAHFFDQRLDHSNPSLGTGEVGTYLVVIIYRFSTWCLPDASGYTGYLLNETITGAIAYAVGGANIVLEHRYWGASVPFADYSTANMKYLTIENNVQDYAYFAQNVQLPWASGAKAVPPPQTPWILAGGSYPGALAGYVKHTFPDLFYASYGTSGPAIIDYYGYFTPVEAGAPQNCTADMKAVITHWDSVMQGGTVAEQRALMSIFGLQNVTHIQDASSALQVAPWDWQALAPAAGAGQAFFNFCDALEVKEGISAGPEGQGLDYALQQWGAWQIQTNIACAGIFSTTTTAAATNAGDLLTPSPRPTPSWVFSPLTVCRSNGFFAASTSATRIVHGCGQSGITQLAFWEVGQTEGPFIVSKLVDVEYAQRQCALYFPPEDGVSVPAVVPVDEINAVFGGWDISEDHMLFVNGQFDPWRSGSVSSQLPGASKLQSTAQQPILLIETERIDLFSFRGHITWTDTMVENCEYAIQIQSCYEAADTSDCISNTMHFSLWRNKGTPQDSRKRAEEEIMSVTNWEERKTGEEN